MLIYISAPFYPYPTIFKGILQRLVLRIPAVHASGHRAGKIQNPRRQRSQKGRIQRVVRQQIQLVVLFQNQIPHHRVQCLLQISLESIPQRLDTDCRRCSCRRIRYRLRHLRCQLGACLSQSRNRTEQIRQRPVQRSSHYAVCARLGW